MDDYGARAKPGRRCFLGVCRTPLFDQDARTSGTVAFELFFVLSERFSCFLDALPILAPCQYCSFLDMACEGFMVSILVDFEIVGLYLAWCCSNAVIWVCAVIYLVKLNTQKTVPPLQ